MKKLLYKLPRREFYGFFYGASGSITKLAINNNYSELFSNVAQNCLYVIEKGSGCFNRRHTFVFVSNNI